MRVLNIRRLIAVLFAMSIIALPAAAAEVDHSFRPSVTKTNSTTVNVVTPQPDGKYLVSGRFDVASGYARNGLARYNADGTLDVSFVPQSNGWPTSVLVQRDGKILVAGFGVGAVVNGIIRQGIVRLNIDGSLDQTFFNGTGSTGINCAAVQNDGKVVVAGLFSTINGVARSRIARLNPDASLDSSFTAPDLSEVRALLPLPDGKLMVAGGGQYIERLNPDGSLDNTFTYASEYRVNALRLLPGGKILIGRSFNTVFDPTAAGVVRLNADGTKDASFDGRIPGTLFNPEVFSLEVQPDGKILAGGLFNDLNQGILTGLFRFTPDGSLDPSFEPLRDAGVQAVFAQPTGEIVAGGFRSGEDISSRNAFFRLGASGVRDTSFPAFVGEGAIVYSVNGGSDEKVYITGNFVEVNGAERRRVARLNADGSLDHAFDVFGTNGNVNTAAVQPDGKLLIAGDFGLVNGTPRRRVARLLPNGHLDPTFDPGDGPDGIVYQVGLQLDGRILISGGFSNYAGSPRAGIVRLNTDGTVDTAFSASPSPATGINTFHILPDGKIVIGGTFQTVNGVARPRLARLNADGSTDVSFATGSGPNGGVSAIDVGADGAILIGGGFTNYNGVSRGSVARLTSSGTLDASFSPVANNVRELKIERSGKILLGGAITSVNGIPANGFARLNPNGSLDLGFEGRLPANQSVNSLHLLPNGDFLAGGSFRQFAGSDHLGVVRVRVREASVGGRVTGPSGAALRGVVVSLIDPSGQVRNATTSSFGVFHFDAVEIGPEYFLRPVSKRYRFAVRTIQPSGDLANVDLTGLE
jgi:uncharacterized delta-60 repeat protein